MTSPQYASPADFYKWYNEHVWLNGCDLGAEYRQAREEGRDLSTVETEFKRLLAVPAPDEHWHGRVGGKRDVKWVAQAEALIDKVSTLPYRKDYQYVEPSDLAGIKKARPQNVLMTGYTNASKRLKSQLHGGLLGRICGCMLGKPVEGWRRDSIRTNAQETDNWPLRGYWLQPLPSQAKAIAKRKPRSQINPEKHRTMLRYTINGMVEDDDINYTMVGFGILKKHGADFTPLDVATFWGNNLPIFHTCTAERVAYRNFVSGVLPPFSATYRNPYREWIGAQIRADFFGYANPGLPERAAEWAWRDACISHVKNGIYGEMFVAAMIAAAYVMEKGNWLGVINAGLAQIPAKCRLAEDVAYAINLHRQGLVHAAAVDHLHSRWDEANHHDWCHTNSNAQVVVLAMLYGKDDFAETVGRAVMAGFDTDSNGATAGSLWGVMHGVEELPSGFTKPIRDIVRTGVTGYHEASVAKVASEMSVLTLKMLASED